MSDLVSARSARARAMQVQAREIEAHRRAINLQESFAIMFDRVHQTAKSHNARHSALTMLEKSFGKHSLSSIISRNKSERGRPQPC